jgi:hypothetical protein
MCVVMIGGNEGDVESGERVEVRGGEIGGGEDTAAAMFVKRTLTSSCSLFNTRIGCVVQISQGHNRDMQGLLVTKLRERTGCAQDGGQLALAGWSK